MRTLLSLSVQIQSQAILSDVFLYKRFKKLCLKVIILFLISTKSRQIVSRVKVDNISLGAIDQFILNEGIEHTW